MCPIRPEKWNWCYHCIKLSPISTASVRNRHKNSNILITKMFYLPVFRFISKRIELTYLRWITEKYKNSINYNRKADEYLSCLPNSALVTKSLRFSTCSPSYIPTVTDCFICSLGLTLPNDVRLHHAVIRFVPAFHCPPEWLLVLALPTFLLIFSCTIRAVVLAEVAVLCAQLASLILLKKFDHSTQDTRFHTVSQSLKFISKRAQTLIALPLPSRRNCLFSWACHRVFSWAAWACVLDW